MMNPWIYVGGYCNTVTCLVLEMTSGTLTPLSTSDAGRNPTYLAWHPSRAFMYAANEVSPGRISAYAIDPRDGRLTRINDASSAGDGPCHVSVHPSGKWVLAANYGSGTIGVLPVRPDGGVGEPLVRLTPGRNAHQIIADASGRHVFVPCLGSDWVAQYLFDESTGALTPNTPATVPTAPKAGPRHLAFAPSGRSACLINELDNTMTSLAYDGDTGRLSSIATLPTLPDGEAVRNSTAHVLVTPTGRFVYGSNRGHDSLIIYAADPATGGLRLVGHANGGGDIKSPRDFALDPTGTFLLVANQKGDSVTVFRCDAATGDLRKVATTPVSTAPAFVGVMAPPEARGKL